MSSEADMAIATPVPSVVPVPESLPHSPGEDNAANSSLTLGQDLVGGDHLGDGKVELRVEEGDGNHDDVKPAKRVKRGDDKEQVEMTLRQVAEIVMVLVGMAALRADSPPSSVERQLAADAYDKLASLVERVAPEDLVSKHSVQSLIEQLILPSSPVKPPPKPITIQPTPKPAPKPAPKAAPKAAPKPTVKPAPASKATRASVASVPVVPAEIAEASAAMAPAPSAPSQTPTPAAATAPATAPTSNAHNADKKSTTPTNTGKLKSTGRTSPSKPEPVPTSGVQLAPTTVTIKGGQAPKALARQRGAKGLINQPAVDQQLTHQQLAQAVKLIVNDERVLPALPKGASAYMNPSDGCTICVLPLTDTNSVLVCDGCEAPFHLQCLQMNNSSGTPKSDWYCPKCVLASAGRPQPPKYGPLRRGHGGQSGQKDSWSMQGGRGCDATKGQTSGKPLLQLRKREGEGGGAQGTNEPAAVQATSPAVEISKNLVAESSEQRLNGQTRATARMEATGEVRAQQIINTALAQVVSDHKGATSVTPPEHDTEAGTSGKDGNGDDSIVVVDWVGPVVNVSQGNVYYAACSVAGVTMRLQDTAFFRPENMDVPPYIARLQALWEERQSGQKWVKVNWCYYPTDLPAEMGRPTTSDPKEVFESNHSDNNLVGSIQGPCLVLPPLQYRQEIERRGKEGSKEDIVPLFLCQWFYDAPRGLFRAISDVTA